MNEHLNPIFKEILDNNLLTRRKEIEQRPEGNTRNSNAVCR